MKRNNEQGIALVITLFLMASLSALAVSMMFLSQTETSASRNYKTMSQARYAGEAGAHAAINYLMSANYTNTLASLSGLDTSKSPVKYGADDVVLSWDSSLSKYPESTVKTAFAAVAHGELTVGTGATPPKVNYQATARLISMQPFVQYGGQPGYLLTWEVRSSGLVSVPGSQPATVEVTAVVERDTAAAQTYAIFATGAGCGAITLGGTAATDSYDSRTLGAGAPTGDGYGGGVGTNGNLSISGDVLVKGNLDTPRTGVGDCHDGTPTALSDGGHADVTGSIVPLPQAKAYPDPPALPLPPAPYGPPYTGTQSISASLASCTLITAANPGTACSASGSDITVTSSGSTPVVFGNLSVGSHVNLKIQYGNPGTPPTAASGTAIVNANSLVLGAGASLVLGTNGGTSTAAVLSIAGRGTSGADNGLATPLDLSGGAFANPTFDPARLQIVYGGTGRLEVIGGPNAAATVYAPNASVRLNGNATFYGSILSKTYSNNGNAGILYDRSLQSKMLIMGNYMLSSFSWRKYGIS
jgi:hypothetical protein